MLGGMVFEVQVETAHVIVRLDVCDPRYVEQDTGEKHRG